MDDRLKARVDALVKTEVAKIPEALAAADNGDGTYNGIKALAKFTGLPEDEVRATFERVAEKKRRGV